MPILLFGGVNLLRNDFMPKTTFDMWNLLLSLGFCCTYLSMFATVIYLALKSIDI